MNINATTSELINTGGTAVALEATPAVAPETPVPAPKFCACGCDEALTGKNVKKRYFRQGHDARTKSLFSKVEQAVESPSKIADITVINRDNMPFAVANKAWRVILLQEAEKRGL